MRLRTFHRWSSWVVLSAVVLILSPAASASAAMPVAGKLYTGHTTATYHYFTAPVSFRVSRSGGKLLRFKWAGGGCLGVSGSGDQWTNPAYIYKVGTIRVSAGGRFTVRGVKWVYRKTNVSPAITKVTISTVVGRFKTSKKAVGTINFKQRLTKQGTTKRCSGKIRFTAILGPAPGAFHKKTPAGGATNQTTHPKLTWTTSPHATKYQYCLTTNATGRCTTSWVSTGSHTYAKLSGLKQGVTYHWQVRARSVHGTVAADSGHWHAFTVGGIKPKAGLWIATGLTGSGGNGAGGTITVNRVFFIVSSDQKAVSVFGFDYEYSGVGAPPSYDCSGAASSSENTPAPISGGKFSTPSVTGSWTGAGSATFNGSFASGSTAHGTAQASVFISGLGCMFSGFSQTGTFSWTAKWQS